MHCLIRSVTSACATRHVMVKLTRCIEIAPRQAVCNHSRWFPDQAPCICCQPDNFRRRVSTLTICSDAKAAKATSVWPTSSLASQRWCCIRRDCHLLRKATKTQRQARKRHQDKSVSSKHRAGWLRLCLQYCTSLRSRPQPSQYSQNSLPENMFCAVTGSW